MGSQNTEPRGNSRVMKSECKHFAYRDVPPHPTGIAPRLGEYGSFLIPGGEPSRACDRLSASYIEFHGSLRDAAPDAWDASEAEDGSVLAWLARGTLHFAAEGGVIAPESCRDLFARYANCREIRFNGCFDTSRVTDMSHMFYGCTSLEALDLSGLDTSRVTNMGSMFSYCKDLTALNLSKLDTSRVTDMGGMFEKCQSLTALDLSGLNTAQVTRMSGMFKGCARLTGLNLSGLNTSRVDALNEMFKECSSLTALDLSGFDTSQVESLREMFYYCRSLTSLNLSGWNTSRVADMQSLFYSCSSLTALDVSGFDTSRVTNLSMMFSGCESLRSLDVSGFDSSQATQMFHLFSNCKSLKSLDVSGLDTSRAFRIDGMFSGCESLKSLDLSGLDTSRAEWFNSMFDSCTRLQTLNLSNFNTARATRMDYMFFDCASLQSLNLSGFDTAQVTNMECMFRNCASLRSLDLSSFDTARVRIANKMFYCCRLLRSLDISGFRFAENAKTDKMLANCDTLRGKNIRGFAALPQNAQDSLSLWEEPEPMPKDIKPEPAAQAKSKPAPKAKQKPAAQAKPKPAAQAKSKPVPHNGANSGSRGGSRVMMPGCTLDGIDFRGFMVTGIDFIRPRAGGRRWLREDVKRIEFHDSLRSVGADSWDASEQRDRSVLAWMDRGALHFAAEGGVIAPTDSEWQFAYYRRCEEIRFNGCFDTSRVTNMSCMFYDCRSLKALDLSCFDTAQVKNVDKMFHGCESLTALDLSGFDAARAAELKRMLLSRGALSPENKQVYEPLPREGEAAKRERGESAQESKAAYLRIVTGILRERLERAQGIRAAPKPAAQRQAQGADDRETRPDAEALADIWKQHRQSAQDERADSGKAAQKSQPPKEVNPLWLLMVVLFVLFVILAICIPNTGYSASYTGGAWQRSPSSAPMMRTARDIEGAQQRQAHFGSDSVVYAPQEAAEASGGD